MPDRPVQNERLNALTHAIGLVLAVIGAIVLLRYVFIQTDVWRWVSCTFYATSLVGVYLASTLSHSASCPQRKRWFRILDQAFIYLLIVGTYTPFALAYLHTDWWWILVGVPWALALGGFFSKLLFAHRIDAVSIWLYILLGWLPILAAVPLIEQVPATALWWMLIGGLCYTVGTVFLVLDTRVPQFHAIWHLFVMAGSAWHFFAILHYVA